MALFPCFFLFLIHPFSHAAAAGDPCNAPSTSGNIALLQINNRCSPFHSPSAPTTTFDSVLQLSRRVDQNRLAFLSSLVAASSVPIASGLHILDSPIYLLRSSLGSPPQPLFLVLDTASDASFISYNYNLTSSSSSFQPLSCSSPVCPLFNGQPCTLSSSLCSYNQSYGGDSFFSATLSQDILRLGADNITSFTFGAVTSSIAGPTFPKHGLLGLGRGPVSFLSQTQSLYSSVFSYCLPSYNSYYFSGSLRLGPRGQPARIRSTPLLLNPPPALSLLRQPNRGQRRPRPRPGPARLLRLRSADRRGDRARRRHRHHPLRIGGLRRHPRRVPEAGERYRGVPVAGRVLHVLLNVDWRWGDGASAICDAAFGGFESRAASGELFDTQQRAAAGVFGDGGGTDECEHGGERHCQLPAAEPPGAGRRSRWQSRFRTGAVQLVLLFFVCVSMSNKLPMMP
ncbi:hypothetical protein HPP92_009372 [Vanilla planifolia]|uniref:Xylanase inhibitor N-terminal domain-containing protein n=1 Tax=Vanilla planifolia TaxID=51239 RepID=A0A835R7R7_VANPL|nr:hypothetical protein HPP92_009372 [Vanilla planifolia]